MHINHIFPLKNKSWLEEAGFYFLPNTFTLAALFCAFFAIIETMNHQFHHVGWLMVACLIFDGLDGRIARYTGKQGRFGEEMDSIADMVSFGVVPALVAYQAILSSLGWLGYAIAFVYCACAAFRLALFNSLINITQDKRWFIGVPSPSAASMVVGFIWLGDRFFSFNDPILNAFTPLLVLFAALSMAVPVHFWSFKGLKSTASKVTNNALIISVLVLLFVTEPSIILFGFFFLYMIIGYAMALIRYLRRRSARIK